MAESDRHTVALDAERSHKLGCATKHEPSSNFSRNFSDNELNELPLRCMYRNQGYMECSRGEKASLYNINFVTDPSAKTRLPKHAKNKNDALHSRYWRIGHAREDRGGKVLNPLVKERAWWIGPLSEDARNFKVGYLPYNHMYHHIIPWEAFKREFDENELKCLQASGYNLNGLKNMIILPREDEFAFALSLVSHPNNHPRYNIEVQMSLNMIRVKLQKTKDDHGVTNKNKSKYREEIEDTQAEIFELLVEMGKAVKGPDRKLQ